MADVFDLQAFLQETMGAKVLGAGDQPNSVKVQVGDLSTGRLVKKTQELDINAIKADVGIPENIPVEINQKSSAVDDSPLGFLDRLEYSQARKPSDKAKYLHEKFGKENVSFEPETKEFKVNKQGAWHNADATGLTGFVGEEGDVIAGAMAGGALGSLIPIPVVGTVIGAGVGAAVARFGTMKAAEAAGLRSEEEATEVMKEVGKEFLLGMGGEAIGLGVKGGVAFVKGARKAMGNIAAAATTPEARLTVAEILKQATNVKVVDNMTWLEAPAAVAEKQTRVVAWKARGEKGINPVKSEMADTIQEGFNKAKDRMYKDYTTVFEPLQEITKNVKVPSDPLINSIGGEFKAMGLIDENRNWIPKEAARLQETVNTADVRRLKQTYDILRRSVGQTEGTAAQARPNLSFEDALTVKRNFDEILEAAGHYNKGSAEITSATKARISGYRNQLKDAIQGALSEKNPAAGDLYANMNKKFSARREWIDDVAGSVGDDKIDATMKRMLGPDGDRSREAMINALKDSGVNAELFMNNLYQSQAALNTVDLCKIGSSGHSSTAGGLMRLSSPRKTTPMVAKTFAALKNFADSSEFVKSLPKGQREELIKNPQALRALSQITSRAIGIESDLPDQLVNKALEQSNPMSLPPPPQEEQ